MTLYFNLEFVQITPGCCNVPFAMSKAHYQQRRKDHEDWWCPNCGTNRYYAGETDEQKKLRELQEDLNNTRRNLNVERTGRREAQKQYARMRTRVQRGLCPCCEKKFENLRDHMAKAHKLTGGDMLKTLRETFGLTQHNLEQETGVQAAYVSKYENGHTVPEWANESLQRWMQNEAA